MNVGIVRENDVACGYRLNKETECDASVAANELL